jgi:nitrogen regulatory protein P-II 2
LDLERFSFTFSDLVQKAIAMKMIVAVIKPSRLDTVLEAVTRAGATGLTVSEVRGYGRQKGKTEVYRGAEYEVKLLPKVRLEIAVSNEMLDVVAQAVVDAANTGKIGDGKLFVLDLESALRIRTGERDVAAITG